VESAGAGPRARSIGPAVYRYCREGKLEVEWDENNKVGTLMKVGFIGLGTMGYHMAANLQAAGYQLIVNDLRQARAQPLIGNGSSWAQTPREVAADCEVIFTSLPGPREVEAVTFERNGLLAGIRQNAAYFDLSTNSRTTVQKIHRAFSEKGAHMLDAPVSGGPRGAKTRKLALWVGGERQIFERHRALLDAIGDQVSYIGAIGQGTVAKLVHNCSTYALNVVLAEVFTVGVKAGVDPLVLFKAIRQGAAGRRRTYDGLIDHFLPGRYEPAAFALNLAHKDVALASELGREIGVPMRLCNLALEEMTEALARGWGQRDSRCVMLLQQERAGTSIAVEAERLRGLLTAEGTDGTESSGS
jgi:3-hydroxyisobutyrate dehydrogenase-like beta-hydroxyacid dehydrogenase